MLIGIPREPASANVDHSRRRNREDLPEMPGTSIVVESSAGQASSIPDADYVAAGARIGSAADALGADLVLKVRAPTAAELPQLKSGAAVIGMLNPFDAAGAAAVAASGVTAFALESLPRISRAQSMDVLSSQANIAGYKAVMMAANEYARFMPMLMTAAGTVKAARVLIMGVGVAGLQAIATAKRLGAVIEATDVRPSVKDQVESLGGKWVDVPYANDEERKIAEGVAAMRGRCRRNGWRGRQASSPSAASRWTS
jgi:NAD(P) transhydrogenase subunit alpha